MTSTPFTPGTPDPNGAEEHPEVAEISALAEGLLSVERQQDVRSHLADCSLCADVRDSLDEIRDLLGTLPGPARMPEDVAGRIDAALAAEALLDATGPHQDDATGPHENRATGPHEEGENDHAPAAVSRETTSSETAHPTRPTRDRPAGHAPASTGPGRQTPRRGRRRWRAVLAAAATVAVLGGGGLALQMTSDSSADTTAGKSASGPRAEGDTSGDTGSTKSDRALKHRVQTLLSQQEAAPNAPSPSEGSGTPDLDTKQSPGGGTSLREDTGGNTVPSCVREGIDRTETPLAVDAEATYEKRPGYLVVLPHRKGDPDRVDAYLVDPSCIGADPSGPGKVLLKRTYPHG